jgi:hypothetical protein
MSSASIVTVLSARPDSLEAVRWAAWLSQHTGLPLDVVHAYPRDTAFASDLPSRVGRESRERALARSWLAAALDECPALPVNLNLVVEEGGLEEVVEAHLHKGGVLVSGSHGPAGLVSWGCRIRHCPVVLVPPPDGADERSLDGPDPHAWLAVTGVPA